MGQKTRGAMSVLPGEPERTGRQREYIEDRFVVNIWISGIPLTLPERLLTVKFGLLQLVDAHVGLQSICKNFCQKNRCPSFRNLLTKGYTAYTLHIWGLVDAHVGLQSICINFCQNNRCPSFRNLLTKGYIGYTSDTSDGGLCIPV